MTILTRFLEKMHEKWQKCILRHINNTFLLTGTRLKNGEVRMTLSQKIGYHIFKLMCRQGITEEELAKRINISPCDFWRILEGDLIITPRIVENIAIVLRVDKSELIYPVIDRLQLNAIDLRNSKTDVKNKEYIMHPKRFSIIKKSIDIQELISKIFEHKSHFVCSNYKPYIFANQDTINELIKISGYGADGLTGVSENSMCGYFNGCKVFCDDILQFGEIELR